MPVYGFVMTPSIDPLVIIEKTAEYLATARTLAHNSPTASYLRANCLAMELALILPAHLYRSVILSIPAPNEAHYAWDALLEVRGYLHGGVVDLTRSDAVYYAPGAGQAKR